MKTPVAQGTSQSITGQTVGSDSQSGLAEIGDRLIATQSTTLLMALRMTFLINRLMDEVPRDH
jgi:hypothetical protein